MLKAVFISDVHLETKRADIASRCDAFLTWFGRSSAEDIYILGDLFHVWFGDDVMEPCANVLAKSLSELNDLGKRVWFMPGNRDFLLGEAYAAKAGMRLLPDPFCVHLGQEKILLAHGDAYCTADKQHQIFRALTRNAWVQSAYRSMPTAWRVKLVDSIRHRSNASRQRIHDNAIFNTEPKAMLADMQAHETYTLIHGHTHKPGKNRLEFAGKNYTVWVLSDWDDTPQILCYDDTKGLYYMQNPQET